MEYGQGSMTIRNASEKDARQIAEILVEDWKTAYRGIIDSDYLDSMSVEEYRAAAINAVKQLSRDVGIPEKLEALKEEDLPFLAQSAYDDACRPGNPKDCDVESLTALFHKLM